MMKKVTSTILLVLSLLFVTCMKVDCLENKTRAIVQYEKVGAVIIIAPLHSTNAFQSIYIGSLMDTI